MEDVALEELRLTRLSGIHRRWPRYRWDHEGQSRWEGWSTDRYLGFGIAGCLAAATFLELALWAGNGEPWFAVLGHLGYSPAGRVVILSLTSVNAWLLGRWITSHLPGERRLSLWLRVLRPLAVGIPVVGLATVPAWRGIARRPPTSAGRKARRQRAIELSLSASPNRLLRLQAAAERWVRPRGQRLRWLLLWLVACQITPLLGGLSWLMGNGPLGPLQRKVIVAVCVALHLIAALCGALYGRTQAVPSARRLRLLPWLLLIPIGGILSVTVMHPASFHPREEGLFIQAAYSRRPKGGLSSEDLLLQPQPAAGDAELHRLAFFRLKTLLFAVDAAALSWFAARLAGWDLGLLTRSENGVALLLLPALPGISLAVAGVAARWAKRWPALREIGRHSYGGYLALCPIVLSSGLVVGSLLTQGNMASAGLFLFAAALASLLWSVLFLPISALAGSRVQADATKTLWFLLWFEMMILGVLLSNNLEPFLIRMFATAFALTPAWSLGLFLALGPWLLRPFTLRHLLDPRLPLRTRGIVTAVAVSAALPLGGLAVPFWIYAHHRLWPTLERSLAEAVP